MDPLALVDKLAGKHMAQPALQCVRIRATGTKLELTATNLEVGIEMTVPATVAESGVVAVVGSVLSGLLQTMQSGASVTLSLVGGFLEVAGPTSVSRVATQDAQEFPELPRNDGGESAVLAAKELREALLNVSFCASTSTIKPELASVFAHFDGSTLITAATDSFRLAEKRTMVPKVTSLEPILIPARSIPDILRVLDRVRGEVTAVVGQHILTLETPGMRLTTRLVSGTFPDYKQIIPSDFRTTVTMLTFDIEQVVRKAGIFIDQFNKTTLAVDAATSRVEVHTESKTVGENTDHVAATVEGGGCTLSFNQRYLADVFQVIRSDSLRFCFVGDGQPLLIRPLGDESYLYLVMPMNR